MLPETETGGMARRRLRFTPTRKMLTYLFLAFAVIMLFRMIIPGGDPQLKPFSANWRLLRGVLTIADYFPALVLSAFVVPFGYRIKEEEDMVFVPANAASLSSAIIRAVTVSCIYGLLLFFIVPLASDAAENMQTKTTLYRKSRTAIRELLFKGGVLTAGGLTDTELSHARQYIAVCDYIWPEGNDIPSEREEVYAEIEQRKLRVSGNGRSDQEASVIGPLARQPVNAAEALRFAQTAMEEKRYYDTHWLAGLARRLAPDGSIEQNAASRLSVQALAAIERIEPSADDIRAHEHYQVKRDGYAAMIAEDWVRAYYIFLELQLLTPNDPDLENFIARCEEGIQSIAFFTDEVSMTSPLLKTDAVFSVPRIESGGRLVFRAESLSLFNDAAYALNVEILGFDALRRPVYSIAVPYARITPVTIGGRARSVVYMRALDRHDKNLRWEPKWEGQHEGDAAGNAELVIDISYEDILIACEAEVSDTNYRFASLHAAGKRLSDYGFVPEVFSVIEIRSISEPLMMLPFSIFAVIIGWRYRVRSRRARYALFPMLIVLPLVFNTLVHLCRHLNNSLATWAVLTLSQPVAVIANIAGTAILFITAILVLAYQKDR
jgi:hypothetical protein